MFPRTVI